MRYTLRYTVSAATKLEAIEAAVAKLRSSLRLVKVVSADPLTPTITPAWWIVRLHVFEDV